MVCNILSAFYSSLSHSRHHEGGLGIDVDKSNVIFGNRGQRDLQLGDRVLAIDGVPLGRNSLLAADMFYYLLTCFTSC
jgi:hypothetical protein